MPRMAAEEKGSGGNRNKYFTYGDNYCSAGDGDANFGKYVSMQVNRLPLTALQTLKS